MHLFLVTIIFSIPQFKLFYFVCPTNVNLKMAGEQSCSECGSVTKYRCITVICLFAINRPMCSMPEKNEDIEGWVHGKFQRFLLQ